MDDVVPDQVIGDLGPPPEQARHHFMMRLMQDNAMLRLQLTRPDTRAMPQLLSLIHI